MADKSTSTPFLMKSEAEKRKLCPIPEPKQPWRDWTWYTLFVPVLIAGLGVMAFAILAYSFTEVREALAQGWATRLVVSGAIAMAIGGEFGTGFTILEVFRKHTKGETRYWDWLGLCISFVASTMSLFLSWAWLSGIMASWTGFMQDYGPLILGFCGVADFYAGWMEAGLYKGTYEARFTEWEEKHYHPWRTEVGIRMGISGSGTPNPTPVASIVVEKEVVHAAPAISTQVVEEPRRRIRTVATAPKPGAYEHCLEENEEGVYAVCPCGWGKQYGTRRGALGGISGHNRSCGQALMAQEEITAKRPLEGQVVTVNTMPEGDF